MTGFGDTMTSQLERDISVTVGAGGTATDGCFRAPPVAIMVLAMVEILILMTSRPSAAVARAHMAVVKARRGISPAILLLMTCKWLVNKEVLGVEEVIFHLLF